MFGGRTSLCAMWWRKEGLRFSRWHWSLSWSWRWSGGRLYSWNWYILPMMLEERFWRDFHKIEKFIMLTEERTLWSWGAVFHRVHNDLFMLCSKYTQAQAWKKTRNNWWSFNETLIQWKSCYEVRHGEKACSGDYKAHKMINNPL